MKRVVPPGAVADLDALISLIKQGPAAGQPYGARLAGPIGRLAAALDGTDEATALRRLRVRVATLDAALSRDDHALVSEIESVCREAVASLAHPEISSTSLTTSPETPAAAKSKAPAVRKAARRQATVPIDAREAHQLPEAPAAAAHGRLCATPLTELPRVGPAMAQKLEAAGIRDIGDLLLLRPRRYQDRRRVTAIKDLRAGEFAVVVGRIARAAPRFYGGGRFVMDVTDDTGTVSCAFFRINLKFASTTWKPGLPVVLAGPVTAYRDQLQMTHPTVDIGEAPAEGELRPEYPAIDGIGERVLRRLIEVALERHADELPEPLPASLRERLALPDLATALRRVHRPPPDAEASAFVNFQDPALRRFIFDELLVLQLALGLRRRRTAKRPALPVAMPPSLDEFVDTSLPFAATGAQRRVIGHIAADLASGHPMHRLLQGDVGSGKTAVAYVAARLAQRGGLQTALMVPTELLAQQHLRTLSPWFEGAGLRCGLLTNGLSRRDQRMVRELTLAGVIHCLIGTHSLIGQDVGFAKLGLVIVDEQHRFGVKQRLALRQKAILPHLLVMTATPIPRTLALTAYGDLEVSVLDELPPGRLPILTTLHGRSKRAEVYARVRSLVDQGHQVYVVFPLVEESEFQDLADATSAHEELSNGAFAGVPVGLVHGRMASELKEVTLRAFAEGELRVLVSTTVIEVGIDVPAATVMLIEHADRFGLSQLHQLRGRIGRGGQRGFCLLLADERATEEGAARLKVMTRTQDGFVIAQADLEQRGPGQVLGTKQAGVADLEVADLVRDASLLEAARETATALLDGDPELSQAEHLVLRRLVWSRWGEKLELAEAG